MKRFLVVLAATVLNLALLHGTVSACEGGCGRRPANHGRPIVNPSPTPVVNNDDTDLEQLLNAKRLRAAGGPGRSGAIGRRDGRTGVRFTAQRRPFGAR
jgi:hypothetical protein